MTKITPTYNSYGTANGAQPLDYWINAMGLPGDSTKDDVLFASAMLGQEVNIAPTPQELRSNFYTQISGYLGGDGLISPEDAQAQKWWKPFSQQAIDAGLDPVELINQRNNNINTYNKGSFAGRLGNWFDETGVGSLLTYGTIAAAAAGAAGAFSGAGGTSSSTAAGGSTTGSTTGTATMAPGAGVIPSGSLPTGTVASGAGIPAGYSVGAGGAIVPAGGTSLASAGIGTTASNAANTTIKTAPNAVNTTGSTMPKWVDIVTGVAPSIIGGAIQTNAANDAIDASNAATQMELDFLRESRDMAIEMNKPFYDAAVGALPTMQSMVGIGDQPYDVTADPSYQWRHKEGMRALENSAFARGGGMHGRQGHALLQASQDMASQEYQAIFNRVATIAGYGVNAANTNAGVISNYGANAATAVGQNAANRMSSYTAIGNAQSQAVADIANLPWSSWFNA